MTPPPVVELRPAQVFHVSGYIFDEMVARGWTLPMLAVRMGGDAATNLLCLEMTMYVHDPDLLLGEMAAQLEAAFGVSAECWRNIETVWRNASSDQRSDDPICEKAVECLNEIARLRSLADSLSEITPERVEALRGAARYIHGVHGYYETPLATCKSPDCANLRDLLAALSRISSGEAK